MTSVSAMLASHPLFAELDADAIEALAALARPRDFPAGTIVCLQGDPGDALYVILSGQVRVSIDSADGETRHLNLLGPGELIGEIALLDGGPRTANMTTTEDSRLAVIERNAFVSLLERMPKVAIQLLALVSARVRWTSDLVEDAAFLSGPERLAKRVLELTRLAGPDERIQISQATLAAFCGLSRQAVNGQLREWSEQGYLETGRGTIRVLDAEGLARLTGSGLRGPA